MYKLIVNWRGLNRIVAACAVAAAVCNLGTAQGALLVGEGSTLIAERDLLVHRDTQIFQTLATTHFDLELSFFGNSFSAPTNLITLVETGLSPGSVTADIDTDFEFNSGPLFDAVVARLTDGIDEFIQVKLTETSSGRAEKRGFRESGFFASVTAFPGPDLAGAQIAVIQLRIDDFVLTSGATSALSASLPAVSLSMTFTVLGAAIPEPGSLGLAASGLATATLAAYTVSGKRRRAHVAAANR